MVDNTNYSYFNKETNKNEPVVKELWHWEAHYSDGTVLKQFQDGQFHRFAEIDSTKLHIFRMVSDESPVIHDLVFNPEEMKLIHFYKQTILEAGSPNEHRFKVYCFGYEKNIGGQVVKNIIMLLGDTVIITDNPDNINFE